MSNDAFDLAAYLKDLEYLVNIDSGSRDPAGTAKIAEFFRQKFTDMGWQGKTHSFDCSIGPCLELVNTDKDQYDMLLMGHMDTVFESGTAKERPFSLKAGKAFGPGVADMKAGLLSIYYILSSLQREGKLNNSAICVALNSDEEISSKFSRPWLEKLSKKSSCALVFEPARADGNLVNRRKGVGRYKVEITGVAAHSGVDPEKGCSAIQELAHWILALPRQTNYQTGTTVNVGLVSGGTAVNVVADKAVAEIDLRICSLSEAQAIEKLMHRMAANPKTPGVTAKITGGITRPPMNPQEKTMQLCRIVESIGAEMGVNVGWTFTGGGSDGCFSANLGVPTIDGLGPVGGGAHSADEYILIDSIQPRYGLVKQLIQRLALPGRIADNASTGTAPTLTCHPA